MKIYIFMILTASLFMLYSFSGVEAATIPIDFPVRCVAEDKNNLLWFGTDRNGLLCFDGSTWKQFTSRDGLASNLVRDIAIDHDNVMWLSTQRLDIPITKYDGISFVHYPGGEILPKFLVTDIAVDYDNVKWFATYYGGVWSFDGATWNIYTAENSGLLKSEWVSDSGWNGGNCVLSVFVDKDNSKWFGSNEGLSKFDGEEWQTWKELNGAPLYAVHDIYQDSRNTIWLGLNDNVASYDGSSWEFHNFLSERNVYTITEDHDGVLWVGRTTDVWRFDGSLWDNVREIPGTYHWVIFEDIRNVIWFGYEQGLMSFDGKQWSTHTIEIDNTYILKQFPPYNFNNKDNMANTSDIALQGNHRWFSTLGKGAAYYDGDSYTFYNTANSGIASDAVNAVAIDHEGTIWFGTDNGVSLFDGSVCKTYTVMDGLAHNDVKAIVIGELNRKWFGTFGGGVSMFDGVNWETYTKTDGIADNEIISLAMDKDGILWLGGNTSGVTSFDGNVFSTYDNEDGLFDNHVSSIDVDRDNTKWFATGAVSSFDGTIWRTFSKHDGLWADDIITVYIDSENRKWFGSQYFGLYCKVGNDLYHDRKYYGGPDIRTIALDSEGYLWIASSVFLSSISFEGQLSFVESENETVQAITIGSYPNPSNSTITISFTIPFDNYTTLTIYDILGRQVNVLICKNLPAGFYTALWNGKNSKGGYVASGLYIAYLQSHNLKVSHKLLLIK